MTHEHRTDQRSGHNTVCFPDETLRASEALEQAEEEGFLIPTLGDVCPQRHDCTCMTTCLCRLCMSVCRLIWPHYSRPIGGHWYTLDWHPRTCCPCIHILRIVDARGRLVVSLSDFSTRRADRNMHCNWSDHTRTASMRFGRFERRRTPIGESANTNSQVEWLDQCSRLVHRHTD